MKIEKYFKPATLEEFFKIISEAEHWKIVAGGTFVSRQKYIKITTLIDIQLLKFNYIKEDNDLHIGSMTTFTDFIENNNNYAKGLLLKSFKKCGPITVRNIATIGGNVMGGYYWNDTTPVLLYLKAKLLFLKDPHNELIVKMEDFINNRREYKNMLLKEIILPEKYKNLDVFYNRFARTESDIPSSIFLAGKIDNDHRIVIGAATVKPFAIDSPSEISFEEIKIKTKEIHVMNDLRGSSEYKLKLIKSQYNEYKEMTNEN